MPTPKASDLTQSEFFNDAAEQLRDLGQECQEKLDNNDLNGALAAVNRVIELERSIRSRQARAWYLAQRAASAALDALALERVHKALVLEASHCGEVAIVMLRCGDSDGAERMARKAAGFGLVALAAR